MTAEPNWAPLEARLPLDDCADHVTLPLDDLKALFDIAVGSMNFGSGFLDTEEVETLRRVAVTIGVDPVVATPSGFATQYPHAYQDPGPYVHLKCKHCGRSNDDPIHPVNDAGHR